MASKEKTPLKGIVLISAGAFAREVSGWINQCIAAGANWYLKGFLDNRTALAEEFDLGAPILNTCEEYLPEEGDLFLCALGEPVQKKKYSTMIEEKGGLFANLIHPTAIVGERIKLGHGIILAPFSALTSDLTIGNHVTISSFSGAGHDVKIGDYTQISSHCALNGHVQVGEGVFMGAHSCVCPKVTIGSWAYIGAGSVVLRRVHELTKVFGNPAVPIGTVDDVI